jgi:hypothetical protein
MQARRSYGWRISISCEPDGFAFNGTLRSALAAKVTEPFR